jgi:hypothetical protein
MTRPHISDSGPRNRGIAYARTKTDNINDCSTELVTPNSFAMVSRAGATMVEETGEMKVKEETGYNN